MRRLLALAPLAVLAAGCAVFDAPPEVSIEGLTSGLLADPKAPIVLSFSKPPVPSTVKLEIAKYIVDGDGLLVMPLQTLYTHDPVNGDTGGMGVLSADGSTFTVTLPVPPPVGLELVVVVEPGLADAAGTVTVAERSLVFGYQSVLTCDAPAHVARSGVYFFLVSVDMPIAVQIQLFGDVSLDDTTGQLKGKFTKAKRNPDPNRCSPPCPTTDACQLVPTQMCVTPSTVAGSVDEFSDYIPNPDPPTGFSFEATGCAIDQDASTSAFATAPVDVAVQSPMVTLRNTALSSSFTLESDGTLRGTGSLTADAVLIGTINSGSGHGNLTVRSIDPSQVPPGVPGP
jgi:hypothetical protein